ncbi:hypothetical protein HMPREF9089_00858 [Eubacterium brachy ATCC 33089]|nr:hypothetical protein HMPREF9089_00858 [Eubacterium brachy ATCC 33089]
MTGLNQSYNNLRNGKSQGGLLFFYCSIFKIKVSINKKEAQQNS